MGDDMAVRVPFRLRKLAWLVSATLAATGTAAAAPAGRVDFAIGGVTVTGTDGRSRPAAKGLELQSGDRIVTTDGRAQIRFTDGAYVSLQPGTDFSIRDYRYDGRTDGTEKGAFGLLRGALRTVTGAIGRVNRGAYQIQTPTATIGIRGTGGLIQILPDGSTLVTGNSGVWSVANRAGAVDVPAGKAAKAGPNQTIPPSESVEGPVLPPPGGALQVRLVQAWDNLPSALPDPAPYAFVAGDNVTSSGLPGSLPAPPNCGTPAGCEVAYATLVSFSGASTQFHANPRQVTLGADGAMTAFNDGNSKALTGTHVDGGALDGVVAWGRWVGGATINGTPWSGFQTLAYVTGLPTPIADITSMSGTFTFNLVGWTAPTDGTNTGVVTGGQLIGHFGPSPTVDIKDFTPVIAGKSYNMAQNGIPVPTTGPYAPFSASAGVTGTGGGACAFTACSAQVNGHFMGAGASHAGFSYRLTDGGTQTVGAAAFKR